MTTLVVTTSNITAPPVTTEQLLRTLHRLPAGHPDRELLRARAIENNLPLAKRLALHYAGRGERFDDLAQVAALALVRAVDRYSPDRNCPFLAFAVPTILGALKRHFRDTAWGMRVPRSTQELLLDLPAATSHLTQLRGRPPTPAELGDHLGVDVDVLLAAIAAAQVYRLPSLNAPATGTDDADLVDLVGTVDPGYGCVDDRMELGSLVATLPLRERRILTMRFYGEWTQARIAAEIGVSQMHVSRLLSRALTQLRVAFLASAGDPAHPGAKPS
ncbi:sigma-70 family RNA polymerase sigma factor [Virgisporangium aurantiacum]|uniref:RNA polymerase sigma factor n=1 Tax=Virgisporangium aurantiacum TaxID=175570 RepID=A0A8J3Z1B9_9ACTN|nr:sigma-70 family RNA polymerase sigma factor [Virgisporangium aurantiacum]GIJ54468.1 RNA polymerase sigma factor [Virgisporangium aurantiacum]